MTTSTPSSNAHAHTAVVMAATFGSWIPLIAATVAFIGVLITLIINGARTERQRRRDLHARALAAIAAYGEMPFRIRRRPPGPEQRSRLSDELSQVKAEVDTCQVLLAADGNERVSIAYDALYAIARNTAGTVASDAWKHEVISTDAEMNQPELFQLLKPFNAARNNFAEVLRAATLPWWKRLSRWALIRWPGLTKIPGLSPPRSPDAWQSTAPQDSSVAPETQSTDPTATREIADRTKTNPADNPQVAATPPSPVPAQTTGNRLLRVVKRYSPWLLAITYAILIATRAVTSQTSLIVAAAVLVVVIALLVTALSVARGMLRAAGRFWVTAATGALLAFALDLSVREQRGRVDHGVQVFYSMVTDWTPGIGIALAAYALVRINMDQDSQAPGKESPEP